MKRLDKIKIFSYGVIGYMLLAFLWWSVLLHNKNQDAFKAKTELLRLGMAAERLYISESHFQSSPAYAALSKSYKRQQTMIIGETLVFAIIMIIGIILINRGYNKEVKAAKQQQNFLLSITHELKSPLASIKLVLQTLLKRKLNEEQIEMLANRAVKESDRLNQLVNDLLLAARLESSYVLQKASVDWVELIRYCVNSVSENNESASLRFECSLDYLEGYADENAIEIALVNLLENAIKYADGHPEITVRLQKINSTIKIEILDNGPGIPSKEKELIFQKFYRIGNEDVRKTKGTGLGLYIVKSIVEGHQGQIKVSDNLGKGSVFTMELPLKTTQS
jgi:signal transduction histidine kinase